MNVYELVTDKVLQMLDKGTIPWKQDWSRPLPQNFATKTAYSGWNMFSLYVEGMIHDYTSPYWLTFKQVAQLGGSVKKGEKSTMVIFWKMLEYVEETEKEKHVRRIPLLRYYNVFNTDQCSNLTVEKTNVAHSIEECEKVIELYTDKPLIESSEGKLSYQAPFYSPKKDYIWVPKLSMYKKPERYYSTLFHELTHSTGHEKRLHRFNSIEKVDFGNQDYSKEELVAEFGAAFLSARTGISNATIENNASYINGWRKVLQEDKKLIVEASAKAQRAVKYMLGEGETNAVAV